MGTHSAKKTSKDSINRLEIFNQSRPRLQAIAYRMLGSITDAEDMVQETFIKWQQASLLEIKNPPAYLTTIITRLCIDRLRSARVQREQYVGTWLPEPIVSNNFEPQAIVELADSLAMAFLVMLEKLSPIERAVFLLREIFDYDYAEISTIINKSPTNCRQIVRRAKQHLGDSHSRFHSSVNNAQQLTEKFIQACDRGDLSGLIALLAADVTFYSDGGGKVTALLKPMQGAIKVARFLIALRRSRLTPDYTFKQVRVNGQAGVICVADNQIESVITFEIVGCCIQSIYVVRNPDKLGHMIAQLSI
ncbi:MAG: RNA polymerase sigma-70 factor [Waterburya sp.]